MSQVDCLYFSEIAKITNGVLLQYIEEQPIGNVLTDTRKLSVAPYSIFLALCGKYHDSHQRLPEAYGQGVRQFIVEQGKLPTSILQQLPQANILQVPNSIEALQKIAAHHRNKHHLPVVGITGSNGKTIVKEWLSQMLTSQYNVVKNPQSYNSQLGVPLSVLHIAPYHTYGIFEAGISQPGEMAKLASIIQPTMGIFTNIGPAHDEGFSSTRQKIQEKALLFSSAQQIFYCKDHAAIDEVLASLYGDTKRLVHWSTAPGADFTVFIQFDTPHTVGLQIQRGTNAYAFQLPFQQSSYVENAIHCIILLLYQGFEAAHIQQMLHALTTLPMRLTLKQGMHGCQLIDDTYSNDLVSLQAALDFMRHQHPPQPKAVILSDLVQTGLPAEMLYQQVNTLLQTSHVSHLIGIGPTIKAHAHCFELPKMSFYESVPALLQHMPALTFQNTTVLVKGARQFELERVISQLQAKIHSTVLEVNLEAITHNLNFFRGQLQPHTKLMVMVKAFAYGSSRFEVASLLQHHRVDYLGVAYADEGIMLRQSGIYQPIMVMNPAPESFKSFFDYNLEPEVYSVRLLKTLAEFAKKQENTLLIHLKLDTGMRRLGLETNDLTELIDLLQNTPQLQVASLFSHLAGSEAPQHEAFTHQQAALFLKLAQHIEQSMGIRPIKHLVNSAGIIRYPEYHFDMVRLGIGLHGVGLPTEIQQNLQPASTLKSVISQIKTTNPGQTIGYDRAGIATRTTRTATVAIGYADGLSRTLSNGKGFIWVQGRKAPILGNVCMDMCMVDITDIPTACEGDEVIIFSQHHPIEFLASALNTNPYEVLTQISERVKRVYCAHA